MNHWIGSPQSQAWVAPSVAPEGRARIRGPAGTLDVDLRHDDRLQNDVIVIPFGAGDNNPNQLVSRTTLEAFTGQPISNGTVVHLDSLPE
ncbi:MAG: hypothetical protein AAF211_04895 [Myxococcota bacterium]